jgi:cytochrome bd-type quinol oxidase subunit 2
VLFDLLNWYGLVIGLLGLVVLVAHGANFVAARASTPLARRAQRVARGFWWGKLLLVAALAYPTYSVRHEMFTNFGDHPYGMTIFNAASSNHALTVGLRWWSLGIALAIGYFIIAYRFLSPRAKVRGSERLNGPVASSGRRRQPFSRPRGGLGKRGGCL